MAAANNGQKPSGKRANDKVFMSVGQGQMRLFGGEGNGEAAIPDKSRPHGKRQITIPGGSNLKGLQ